jgi:hypothetical protein
MGRWTWTFALYLGVLGCDGAHFHDAQREDREGSYRRYLVRHPAGEHSAAARARLDELAYRAARRSDRPLAFRRYLDQHPRGRFAAAARERLAVLSLERAREPHELELVVERHPGSPQAREAARRLVAGRARLALASSDPAVARRFLDGYPEAREATAVRRHLAALLYRALPDAPVELEAFADEFAGTPSAAQALARLERSLARELGEVCDAELLKSFKLRFPSSSELAGLEARARRCERVRALRGLELAALETAAREEKELARLLAWCRRSPARCEQLRALVRSALPYRPTAGLEELRAAAYDPDLMPAWRAIEGLAWLRAPAAGQELAELTGSARLSVAWRAGPALGEWLGRLGPERRRGWLSRELGRPQREVNDDEQQRRAVVELLADRETSGEARLARLSRRPARALAAGYLLLRHLTLRGRRAPSDVRERFTRAFDRRVAWLREAFPGELTRDSAAAGALCERELFALEQAAASLAPSAELERLRRESAGTLATWQGKLAKASPTFQTARLAGEVAARHEGGRAAALRALRAHRPGGELLAGVIEADAEER